MISILKVPHAQQRYNTVGDWYYTLDGNLVIVISDLDDPDMEACLTVHELTEALLCERRGISQESVDQFDMGAGAKLEEPGESRFAPYHREHIQASIAERQLADQLLVDWNDYEMKIADLLATWKPRT